MHAVHDVPYEFKYQLDSKLFTYLWTTRSLHTESEPQNSGFYNLG